MLLVQGLRFLERGPYDLELLPGQALGLHGPSGAGKTLFLKALADLIPNQGQVSLKGQDKNQLAPSLWRRQVGLLPAESLWWHDSVGEHFKSPPAQLVELGFAPEILTREVSQLSSGEKQRLSLLRLLQHQPQVILLDEPTANLDQNRAKAVEGLILSYLGQHQAGAIWVSHDPAQLRRCCPVNFLLEPKGLTEEAP